MRVFMKDLRILIVMMNVNATSIMI